jgi:hypothetical protein
MRLSLLGLPQSQLPSANRASIPWTVGQLVQGTVLQRLSDSNVIVAIGGNKLVASSPASLAPGQQLVLRVSSLGPRPLLHLVPISLTAFQGGGRNGSIAAGYPSSALQQVLNTLVWLTTNQEPLVRVLPQAVRDLAADVLSAVRTAETLTVPRNFQRAFWDAGLLLEARLASIARGRPVTSEIDLDFKGRLLRLQSALGQHVQVSAGSTLVGAIPRYAGRAPKRVPCLPKPLGVSGAFLERLFATVEAVLQRIEARQLKSLTSGAKEALSWHAEIPFLCGDRVRTVEFVIEHSSRHSSADAAPLWIAHLTLDANGLGLVHARATLSGQTIAVQFWAAHSATLASLAGQTERLVSGLSRMGLSVASIRCHQGTPSDRPDEYHCLIQFHA